MQSHQDDNKRRIVSKYQYRASEIEDLAPPETVLAISATQTGPGVRNKIINAKK